MTVALYVQYLPTHYSYINAVDQRDWEGCFRLQRAMSIAEENGRPVILRVFNDSEWIPFQIPA